MTQLSITGVFLGSFCAMIKVFLTCAVGVVAAKHPKGDPLLPDAALRHLSRLVTFLLVGPLIVVSLGSELTPALLLRYGKLIPFSLSNTLVSLMFWRLLRPMHQSGGALCTTGMVAVLSPNIISLPLMLLQSLCELPLINQDYADSAACFSEGTSMLFVYCIGWQLVYWAVLYPILRKVSDQINGTHSQGVPGADADTSPLNSADEGDWRRHLRPMLQVARDSISRVVFTPAMVGIYVGLFVGLTPGLREMMFGSGLSPLTPVGGTIRVLAAPVVCLNTLIMAASLARVRLPPSFANWCHKLQPVSGSDGTHRVSMSGIGNTVYAEFLKQKSLNFKNSILYGMGLRRRRALTWTDMDPAAVVTGMEFAAPNACEDMWTNSVDERGIALNLHQTQTMADDKFTTSSPLWSAVGVGQAEGSIDTDLIVEDANVVTSATEHGDVAVVTASTAFFYILARLLLPPVATITLLKLAVSVGFVGPHERMMQLVVIVTSSSPSAQMVIVSLNQLGVPDLASQMSFIYVVQYCACIFTLTFWATCAMIIIY